MCETCFQPDSIKHGELPLGASVGAVVRASAFHLWDRGFDFRYGLMWKESVNALLKVVGFLRVLRFPPTGNVDRMGWEVPQTDPSTVTVLPLILGSFRFDYEYEIRQAKRMLYAYAIPYWREKVVAVAHLSTKLWRTLVVLTTTFQKNKESWLFLFSKNNL